MKELECEPAGFKGATGDAAGLLNAAIRSLNDEPEGFSAMAGGGGFEDALTGGGAAAIGAGAGAGCKGEDGDSTAGLKAASGD
jgi:hypothetical protein